MFFMIVKGFSVTSVPQFSIQKPLLGHSGLPKIIVSCPSISKKLTNILYCVKQYSVRIKGAFVVLQIWKFTNNLELEKGFSTMI